MRDLPLAWATKHTGDFSQQVALSLNSASVEGTYQDALTTTALAIQAAQRGSFEELLAYFPGKDLMGALHPSAYQPLADNPKALRRALRDWVRAHPDETLRLLPEWEALRQLLQV